MNTQEERQRMKREGMQEVSPRELELMLDDIGYYIDKQNSFNYTNNLNAITYKAKSIKIRDKVSGLGFANIEADRKNLKKLQEIRRNTFVYAQGRIWEV